jgi:hypothetical protein
VIAERVTEPAWEEGSTVRIALRIGLLACVLAVGVAAAAVAAAAEPTKYAWKGTISTSVHRVVEFGAGGANNDSVQNEVASMRLQPPLFGPDDKFGSGIYGATGTVTGSLVQETMCGDQFVTFPINWSGSATRGAAFSLNYQQDTTEWLFHPADVRAGPLFRGDAGDVPVIQFPVCGDTICPCKLDGGWSILSWLNLEPAEALRLVDTDPRPGRLVGTSSWGLGEGPGRAGPQLVEYSYSVTYDLTRTVYSPACSDGEDNDRDGIIDRLDPGCDGDDDDSELGTAACDDGVDNDGDGATDVGGGDIGCSSPTDTDERVIVTVKVQGPGIVLLPDGTSCVDKCAVEAEGPRMTIAAMRFAADGSPSPLRTVDAFVSVRGCPVAPSPGPAGRLSECVATFVRDTTVTARYSPVVGYAPRAEFQPDERYWPMSPDVFVANSRLRWASQGQPRFLCGRSTTDKTDETIVRRIPAGDVRKLQSGGWKRSLCWNRAVGRRGAPGPDIWVDFDTNDLTSPAERKDKKIAPNSRWGFYLDLADELQHGIEPDGDDPRDPGAGDYANAPAMPYEYEPGRYVVYWFFSGRNDVNVGPVHDVHEGDWEHIAVKLDKNDRATHVAYWQHYCQPTAENGSLLRWSQIAGDRYEWTHPPVYVARGAHASYPKPGHTWTPCEAKNGLNDHHNGGGIQWFTWVKGQAGFQDVTTRPWYGFGGGWGSKTPRGSSSFWGPLGPGRLKPPVPNGW